VCVCVCVCVVCLSTIYFLDYFLFFGSRASE
jgi:hypothetical protein